MPVTHQLSLDSLLGKTVNFVVFSTIVILAIVVYLLFILLVPAWLAYQREFAEKDTNQRSNDEPNKDEQEAILANAKASTNANHNEANTAQLRRDVGVDKQGRNFTPDSSLLDGEESLHLAQEREEIKTYPSNIGNEIMNNDTNDREDYYNQGNAYYDIKEYEKAIECYEKAITIHPEHAEGYNNRGNAYYALNELEKAIADYNKAININPQNSKAYYNRGSAYYSLKNYRQAVDDYNQAVTINPDYAEVYNNRGNIFYALENYPEALEDYEQAIAIHPTYVEAYYNRGLTYQNLGENEKAKTDFQQAIDLAQQQRDSQLYQEILEAIKKLSL